MHNDNRFSPEERKNDMGRKGKGRHERKLIISTPDDVMLCANVGIRFVEVLALHLRVKQEELIPPQELNSDMMRWREMAVRFACNNCQTPVRGFPGRNGGVFIHEGNIKCSTCGGTGDYRHRAAEMKALRTIAQWTVDVKNDLTGQPREVLQWDD